MKIKFKKIPKQPKNFIYEFVSVKFFGTFAKISSKLAKIQSQIDGELEVTCYRCGGNFKKLFNEKIDFLLSDGIYLLDDERDLDKIIIEIDNHIVDFENICQSEIESFKSDYHKCKNCLQD
jgi:hypothetical protein